MEGSKEKSSNRTVIMVSKQLHGKLNAIRRQLEEIIGKNISLDKALEVVITAKSFDVILTDLILEYYPTELKEPSKKEKQITILEKWFIDFLEEILYPKKISQETKKQIHDKLTMEISYK